MSKFLQKENLSNENVQANPIKTAQRVAIIAALSVDVLGVTANKWSKEVMCSFNFNPFCENENTG